MAFTLKNILSFRMDFVLEDDSLVSMDFEIEEKHEVINPDRHIAAVERLTGKAVIRATVHIETDRWAPAS